jgi:hypothetical protein
MSTRLRFSGTGTSYSNGINDRMVGIGGVMSAGGGHWSDCQPLLSRSTSARANDSGGGHETDLIWTGQI